jgi:hypothetical protein
MTGYAHQLDFLERTDNVQERLAALATSLEGLTTPDAKSGEQWEDGQVWGHMTEFVPFWMGQVDNVIKTFDGEPVPFGRALGSTARIDGIESGRIVAPEEQYAMLRKQLAAFRDWLQSLPEMGLVATGVHSTMGEMAAWQAIDEFLVSHLEQHADQLELLASGVDDESSAS